MPSRSAAVPAAFTGVRLAASVTQGLAFGARPRRRRRSRTCARVAQRIFDEDAAVTRALVCNDARMQEVYWGCFERGSDGLALARSPERVGRPRSVELPPALDGGGGRSGADLPPTLS